MDFSFGIKELNKNEIKLSVSKFSGSIILRKEMCLWIINTLRNATLEDYYTEGKEWETKEFGEDIYCLSIKTDFFVRSTPYSNIEIFPCWNDDEDRFIKYVNSLDDIEFKAFKTDYPLIFDENTLNREKLDELYFNAFKSKEATSKGFLELNDLQTEFFMEVINKKFNINKYFTGKGFTATIDENVFGAGEMVLESTGKETLPLSNANYMTYRYAVDKDCNIKLYKVYDEVK